MMFLTDVPVPGGLVAEGPWASEDLSGLTILRREEFEEEWDDDEEDWEDDQDDSDWLDEDEDDDWDEEDLDDDWED